MRCEYTCRPILKKEIITINDRQVYCYNFLFGKWARSIIATNNNEALIPAGTINPARITADQ